MIPFNDLKAVFSQFEDELKTVAISVIESGYFVLGPNVKSFESEFSNYIGANHCIGVGNGTDAIEIGLRAIGVQAGDEVITVANAGGYTTSACLSIGASPVYVDVDENMLIDSHSVSEAISSKTKAIVATHLYGQAVNIDALRQVTNSIPILEDCAEAHGAKFNGKTVGSIGDIAAFSFYPTKNLGALGDGGAITCQEANIAEKAKWLRQYGWDKKYCNSIAYGRNSRLDEMQAAFLRVLLRNIDELNSTRKNILSKYIAAAPSMFEHIYTDEKNVAHLAVATVEDRHEFIELCKNSEVSTDIHFPVLDCDQESMKDIEFRTMSLSNSRDFIKKIVSIPCYPGMTDEQVGIICNVLQKWNSKKALDLNNG